MTTTKKTTDPAEPPPDSGPATKPAGVTTQDTAPLAGVSTGRSAPPRPRRIIVSEGVKQDLIRLGKVTDPATGYELRLDKPGGKVTAHDRATGKPADIPVI